jgi:hypothetical protein
MNKRIELSEIISHLESVAFISSVKTLYVDEVFSRSVLRIRCNLLPSSHHLDIRLIQTEIETIYSYQLFTDHPIARWDNAPHYPKLPTFPHHYHNLKGEVESSTLGATIFNDLDYVLKKIKELVVSNTEALYHLNKFASPSREDCAWIYVHPSGPKISANLVLFIM